MVKSSNKSTRNQEIDILKGIAMVCMIIGHSIIVYPIDISHVSWCEDLHNFIYSFHMELLFLLSGYLYKKKDYITYLSGKVHRIFVPYLIWGAIFLLMPVAFSAVVHRETPLQDGLINYLFHGGGYWFLYVLFLIFMIYPLTDRLNNWFKGALIIVILSINYFIEIPSVFCLDMVFLYLPYFIIGNILASLSLTNQNFQIDRYFGIVGLLFLCVFVINKITSLPVYFAGFVNTICIIGLVFVIAHFLYVAVKVTNDVILRWLNDLLSLCGQYSLQLYLFNGFLLVILRVLLCSILHIENPIIIVTSIAGFDILISLLVCVYLLPKSKLLSYVCGVKKL